MRTPRQQPHDDRSSALERMVFREVDADRWRDLERLVEAPGGPKRCWCMGFVSSFRVAGFRDVGVAGIRRHVCA